MDMIIMFQLRWQMVRVQAVHPALLFLAEYLSGIKNTAKSERLFLEATASSMESRRMHSPA